MLSGSGEAVAQTTPLRVEASHRSFYRLRTQRRTVVLMVSPPALERNEQFITLARLFHDQGLPVPEIIAENISQGWFLLTDLGNTHLEDVYGSPLQDAALQAAIDALPALGAVASPAIEPYTAARLHMELEIFQEWFVTGLLEHTMKRDKSSDQA